MEHSCLYLNRCKFPLVFPMPLWYTWKFSFLIDGTVLSVFNWNISRLRALSSSLKSLPGEALSSNLELCYCCVHTRCTVLSTLLFSLVVESAYHLPT